MAVEATSEAQTPNPLSSGHEAATRPAKINIPESLVAELYHDSKAAKIGLTVEAFADVLQQVAAKYLTAAASPSEVLEFLTHLRLEDLALARACALGSETGWEVFLMRYREKLYLAAHSIVQGDANARELADSLYADLYGTRSADGRRISKLNSFTGRGSLEGWLRAVMAQEYVNRFRRQQRLVSLEEQAEAGAQFEAESPDPTQAVDARLREATDQALASLAPEDKFILANYYLDGRRLAEIALLLGVHESTISRKLEKITAGVRKAIASGLVKRGMSKKEAVEIMDVEVTELTLDVRSRLMQEKGSETVP
jgi:RNA polymerase sigma-70 factor (ECF subfamily)